MKEWPELFEELGHAPELKNPATAILYDLRNNGADRDLIEMMERVEKGEFQLDFNSLSRCLTWSNTARALLKNNGWSTIYGILVDAITEYNRDTKPPKGNRQITDHIYGL